MRLRVALLSLLATWLFFFEYLPPKKKVHFFSDIEGYHYPLFTYAHQALREGRIPEWDWSIYSGMSFVGNPQNPVLYPPNWLVFALNATRPGVRFTSMEAVLILHFWIAFVLAWLWLRARFPNEIAALLGAGVFAVGGYALAEAQHMGAICAYAWFPLALWGVEDKRWWKTALGASLCLLAGYPPVWLVLAVAVMTYALCRRTWREAIFGLVFSVLLAAVSLGPALEASTLKMKEKIYGGGIPGGAFFFTEYFLPNYYDQSHASGRLGLEQETYLYLGAAGLLGIAAVFLFRAWRAALPGFAIAAVSLLLMENPGRFIESIADRLPFASELMREWNFLAALSAAAAILTAAGWDALWRRMTVLSSKWIAHAAAAASFCWCLRQWLLWRRDGVGFASGWWTLAEVAAALLIAAMLAATRTHRMSIVMLLLFVWVEYKTYGAGRRFNSMEGNLDRNFAEDMRTGGKDFTGIDPAVFALMRRNRHYRIALDDGPHGTDVRHYGLLTPQGFDPFLPIAYRDAVEKFVPFETNRLFRIDPLNEAMLEAFAVRYIIADPNSQNLPKMLASPRYRLLQPATSYYRVVEYAGARPAYRFDSGSVEVTAWSPELRRFRASSSTGGVFQLIEQHFPGWTATIDGADAPIARARIAFQQIQLPPGEHTVEFRFRSKGLRIGFAITAAAALALLLLARPSRR
ncbi:MAG: YfhO family protein [Bryobacterales bacterium]|nr:YfhO family protein [Bryobacterales bacterium]